MYDSSYCFFTYFVKSIKLTSWALTSPGFCMGFVVGHIPVVKIFHSNVPWLRFPWSKRYFLPYALLAQLQPSWLRLYLAGCEAESIYCFCRGLGHLTLKLSPFGRLLKFSSGHNLILPFSYWNTKLCKNETQNN